MARRISQRHRHVDIVIRLTEQTRGYYAKCVAINGIAVNAIGREGDSIGEAIEGAIMSSMTRAIGYELPVAPLDPGQLVFDFAK